MNPDSGNLQVKDIGEQGLLRRVQQYCPQHLVGDDAAVLSLPDSQQLVVTTDLLVDGVHFSDRTMQPYDVGWKAAAANLSDLAAMGAMPIGITVGLALPPTQTVAWVEAVYQGLVDCLSRYQTPILGGDICRSKITTLSITALGSTQPGQTILRSQAQPGDVILTTGVHGASKAGLELLLNPELGRSLTDLECASLIQAHQHPHPRLDLVQPLWEILQASAADQSTPLHLAGMDSSDGLADAIIQICRCSNVGATIWCSHLPQPTCFSDWLEPAESMQWCLYGGEDYELVLTLSPENADRLQQCLHIPCYQIGTITAHPDILLVDPTKPHQSTPLELALGYQHFR